MSTTKRTPPKSMSKAIALIPELTPYTSTIVFSNCRSAAWLGGAGCLQHPSYDDLYADPRSVGECHMARQMRTDRAFWPSPACMWV